MTKTRFTTPIMRMVQGSVDEPQTKDQQGNLRVVKTGPNAGQPNPQYFLGGAIPKNHPEWPAFWATLVNQAVADFPNLFPQGAAPVIAAGGPARPTPAGSALVQAGLVAHPLFSFKVIDGDGFDDNGKANSTKEGFAGHWVVRFGSSYPPRCFHAGRYAANEQIQEKGAIKRGFYIRVNGATDGNANAQRPGLYINLDMIELAGIGPEIVSGPDANDAFQGGPGALPPGATAIAAPAGGYAPPIPATAPPVVPIPAAAPVAVDPMAAAMADGWVAHPTSPGYFYKGTEALLAADVAARYAAPTPPPVVAPPVTPYTGYMGNAALPPVPGAPAVAPAVPIPAASPPPAPSAPIASPSSPVMLPSAGGATYEAMIAAGWTDDTLRQHGHMA